jgi:hypothetical protein
MTWTATKHGDYEAPGFVIVRQVLFTYNMEVGLGEGRFALYRTYKNSNQADGNCLTIGTLEECKEHAKSC